MGNVARLVGLSAVALLAVACAGTTDCDDTPTATGTVLRVSQKCGSASGDGSAAKPFATIGAAALAAKPGTTIAVGPGAYAESVTLAGGVSLKGSGSGSTTIAPVALAGVYVKGPGSTTVSDLKVSGASSFGIGGEGTALKVVGVVVENTAVAKGDGGGGHGIQANGGASLVIEGFKIMNNAGVGVLSKGVPSVSIVDPGFAPAARGTGATAIVDPGFAPASVIGNNAGGGVAIVDPGFAPAQPDSITGSDPVTLTATDVSGNKRFGFAVWGGSAKISRSAIRGTTKLLNTDFADGIVIGAGAVAGAAKLIVDSGSVVSGNARSGVLAAVKAQVAVEGEVSGNDTGGVWAQGNDVEVTLAKSSRLRQNGLVAAAAAHGGRLIVDGARIEDTKMRPFADPAGGMPEQVGDGLGVFNGASLLVKGATLLNNARAGIVVDQAKLAAAGGGPDIDISGSAFSGGLFGIVVNKGAGAQPAAAALKGSNTFDKVATEVDNAGKLIVRSFVCLDKSADVKDCAAAAPAASVKGK